MALFFKILLTALCGFAIALGIWFMYAVLVVLADAKHSENLDDGSCGIVVGGGAFASALLIGFGLVGILGVWA